MAARQPRWGGAMQQSILDVPDQLAAAVAAVASTGPVLVVADAATVGRFAPRWARDFAAARRVHRVRVGGDAAAITAEIRGLGASVVAGIGPAAVCALVATAAAAAGLPCVCGPHGPLAAPRCGPGENLRDPAAAPFPAPEAGATPQADAV